MQRFTKYELKTSHYEIFAGTTSNNMPSVKNKSTISIAHFSYSILPALTAPEGMVCEHTYWTNPFLRQNHWLYQTGPCHLVALGINRQNISARVRERQEGHGFGRQRIPENKGDVRQIEKYVCEE